MSSIPRFTLAFASIVVAACAPGSSSSGQGPSGADASATSSSSSGGNGSSACQRLCQRMEVCEDWPVDVCTATCLAEAAAYGAAGLQRIEQCASCVVNAACSDLSSDWGTCADSCSGGGSPGDGGFSSGSPGDGGVRDGGPPLCPEGTAQCTDGGTGFHGCGYNPASSRVDWGPNVRCSPDQTCSPSTARCTTGTCVAGTVMMVLDRSSSMLSNMAWDYVRSSTLASVALHDDTNVIGLRQFPTNGCNARTVLPMARHHGESFAYAMQEPTGDAETPISAALSDLGQDFGDRVDGTAVVLITDGEESCAAPQDAVRAASTLFHQGIRVFVVAVTTAANRTFLNDVARVGGTGAAHLATDAASMQTALESIWTEIGACSDCPAPASSIPACQGNHVVYCDGDTTQDVDCQTSTCGQVDATLGARCMINTSMDWDSHCGSDLSDPWVHVCDATQGLQCDRSLGVCGREGEFGLTPAGPTSGLVIVFSNQRWGTVCKHGWFASPQSQNWNVACRTFFGAGATGAWMNGYIPSMAVWRDNIQCTGAESSLADCPRSANVNCTGEDVGVWVQCTVP